MIQISSKIFNIFTGEPNQLSTVATPELSTTSHVRTNVGTSLFFPTEFTFFPYYELFFLIVFFKALTKKP